MSNEHRESPMLDELQHDILTKNLSNNPLMPSHIIPALNKALRTRNKTVIGAVNELLSDLERIEETTTATIDQKFDVIGDFLRNPEMLEDMKKIDNTILGSLVKIHEAIVGDINDPVLIEDIGNSVNEAIRNLYLEIADLERASIYHGFTEQFTPEEGQNSFNLKYRPIPKSISVFVNGVRYGEKCFIFHPIFRRVVWTFDQENGGFDLISDFTIKIEYDFMYYENEINDIHDFVANM